MSEVVDIDTLHTAVMTDVVVEIPTATSTVSTRALPEHSEPPRVIWAPSRDRWETPQKIIRGGGATGKTLATVRAGIELHCWGATRAAAWTLVKAIVRALRRRVGPEPFMFIDGGFWLMTTGATTLGEAYVLQISVAIDVPALPAPTTATPTSAVLDPSGSAAGDNILQAVEPT